MGTVLDKAERLWDGRDRVDADTAMAPIMALDEVADGLAFVSSFANVTALRTAEGLVLFDTGSFAFAAHARDLVRGWSDARLHTAVYTHGHVDHCFGVERYDAEGRGRARVIAHANVPARFARYALTQGYNACINARQFRVPVEFPSEFRQPDVTYDGAMSFTVGDARVELHHSLGETDDHTWAYLPAQRAICTGDLFLWVMPNAGNPQKVQRYAHEWSLALRAMSALDAELLLPGHGFPIVGAARVRAALDDTASLLEHLHDAVIARMNEGATLEEVIASVTVPAHLRDKPYLQPVYDEPEFIVRNLWRRYGGWYDGNPAHLKPATERALGRELADLAGGANRLAERAEALSSVGDDALACHLAELAARAAPHDKAIREIRARVYRERASRETSLMARGVFLDAARRPPRGG